MFKFINVLIIHGHIFLLHRDMEERMERERQEREAQEAEAKRLEEEKYVLDKQNSSC